VINRCGINRLYPGCTVPVLLYVVGGIKIFLASLPDLPAQLPGFESQHSAIHFLFKSRGTRLFFAMLVEFKVYKKVKL